MRSVHTYGAGSRSAPGICVADLRKRLQICTHYRTFETAGQLSAKHTFSRQLQLQPLKRFGFIATLTKWTDRGIPILRPSTHLQISCGENPVLALGLPSPASGPEPVETKRYAKYQTINVNMD